VKRLLILILCISLSGLSVAQAVPGKIGAPCSKINSLTHVSGVTLICSTSGKKLLWKKFQASQPAKTAPAPKATAEVPVTPAFSSSDSNIDTCRIADQRSGDRTDGAIAYPAHPILNYHNSGVTNIVVLPVDFSDANGVGDPAAYIDPQIQKASEWVQRYSNGKLQYNFIYPKSWIRAKNPSSAYDIKQSDQGGVNVNVNNAAAIQEFVTTAGGTVSYQDVAAIWVFYTPNQKNIHYSIDSQGGMPITIPTGEKVSFGQFSNSLTVTADNGQLMWGWFLHEMLHAHGLRGHFPIYPYVFGMMAQGGQTPDSSLESWDQLILDWLTPQRVYCSDLSTIRDLTIPIIAKGDDKPGIESVMIRISPSQVLVFELEKKAKWSNGLNKTFSGVLAYLVDSTNATTRDSMMHSDFGTSLDSGSYLVMPGINHGKYKFDGISLPGSNDAVVDGIQYMSAYVDWNQNLALFAGEKTTLMGLTVRYSTYQGQDYLQLSR
jgi:hypothetical protein